MKKFSKRIVALLLTIVMLLPTGIFGVVSNAANIPSDAVEFNGHSYKVFDESMTWTEAKKTCEDLGGYLVTITSQEEQNFVYDLVKKSSKLIYWLGLSDADQEGLFLWITGENTNYANWDVDQPNNGGPGEEDYAEIRQDNGKWNDGEDNGDGGIHSLENHGFVCEWGPIKQFPNGYDFAFDRYYFRNLDETIDSGIYKKAFGPVKGSWLHLIHENGNNHGHCYGMTTTTAAMLKYPDVISTYKYDEDNYIHNMIDIHPEFSSDLLGVDARTYIKYGYVYQFDNEVQKEEKASTNNIYGLYNAVKQYVKGIGDPVIINIYHKKFIGRKNGHSVFAIGLLEENGKKYILINDSNIPYEYQKLEIKSDYSAWSYGVDGYKLSDGTAYEYNSENGEITYSFPADVVYTVGLLLNDNASNFLSATNNLVNSTGSFATDCSLEEILPPTNGTDSETESNKLYWLDNDVHDISLTALEDDINLTVSDCNSSISANLDKSEKADFSVDDENNNIISIDTQNNESVESTFSFGNKDNEIISVSISGTASSDTVTAKQTETGLVVDGISDGTVTLSKDEQVVETQTINNAVSDIEITYDKNSENKGINLDYEHKHSYTADTTDANCENEGKTVYTCSCGDTYTETIAPLGHADANHDGICDNCGKDFTKTCDCMCHNDSKLVRFIYKVMRFFWRLFGMEERHYCSCGKAHW